MFIQISANSVYVCDVKKYTTNINTFKISNVRILILIGKNNLNSYKIIHSKQNKRIRKCKLGGFSFKLIFIVWLFGTNKQVR